MPIYEYECARCGHRLEAIQKVTDARLADCPACGEVALKRLISAAGFQLKGSGWYATDFKNSGKKKDVNTESKTDKGDTASKGDTDSGSSPDSAGPEKKAQGCGGGTCGCAH